MISNLAGTIAIAIALLGFLIVFHELGHFLVARRMGVGVLKFSVGFGKKLFGRRIGDTEYVISAIPLGGFVKMVGEDPDEEISEAEKKISFQHKSVGARIAIVLAGPAANLLLAFLVFTFVFAVYGEFVPTDLAKIGGVVSEIEVDGNKIAMPAAKAGLQPGDVVAAIDANPVATWDELSERIRASEGKELKFTVQRGEQSVEVPVQPILRNQEDVYGETTGQAFAIGIERGFDQRAVAPTRAVIMAAQQTGWWMQTIFTGFVRIIQGRVSSRNIGGPILIVQAAGQQARRGLDHLLNFMAVISVNLGVLNLLPIPILDGGHLFFFAIEAVLGRPLNIRHREIAQQVGLVLLISLMAFALYNDIARVIQG